MWMAGPGGKAVFAWAALLPAIPYLQQTQAQGITDSTLLETGAFLILQTL